MLDLNNSNVEVTRESFLNDLIQTYSNPENRSIDKEREKNEIAVTRNKNLIISPCLYRSKDNKRCAIGQYISDKEYYPEMETKPVSNEIIYQVLPEKIKNLGCVFLQEMQLLHDADNYWNAKTKALSSEGIEKVQFLINSYILDGSKINFS